MDEPLPVLKDFEPDLEPPEPDPWWKRYLAYGLLCFFVPAGCAAIFFGLSIYGFSGSHRFVHYSRYYSAEQFGDWLKYGMAISTVVGFIGTVVYCVKYEIEVQSGKSERED